MSRSYTVWLARVAVAYLSFHTSLYLGIARAQTNISFEEFQTSASELIDQEVQITGKIRVGQLRCLSGGVVLSIDVNTQPGDIVGIDKNCSAGVVLVGNDEEINNNELEIWRQGISLANPSCERTGIITYQGGGSIVEYGNESFLSGGNIESEFRFDCSFKEQELKIGSFYTVKGTVRNRGTVYYIEASAISEQVSESEN